MQLRMASWGERCWCFARVTCRGQASKQLPALCLTPNMYRDRLIESAFALAGGLGCLLQTMQGYWFACKCYASWMCAQAQAGVARQCDSGTFGDFWPGSGLP